jgi:hypothetical protein
MWFAFAFIVAGFIILGGSFSLLALYVFNYAKSHRSGIFRATRVEKKAIGIALLLMFGGFAVIVLFGVGLEFTNGALLDSASFDPPLGVTLGCFLAFVAGIGVALALGLAAGRQRLRAQSAHDLETRALFDRINADQPLEAPLFIYLRPFAADEERTPTEQMIVEFFEQYGTLMCVAEAGFHYGMGRILLRNDQWQSSVLKVCSRATAIIIYPAASVGTFWEFSQIAGDQWFDRTFFFMPPNPMNVVGLNAGEIRHFLDFLTPLVGSMSSEQKQDLEKIGIAGKWEKVRASAREIGVNLPEYCDEGGLFRISAGQVVWSVKFGREWLIGKPPESEREKLNPILDTLIANWRGGDRTGAASNSIAAAAR